ncbi:hypothetical protein MBLNU230_g1376t1 [Neophaeotheca triangularis]
MHMQVVHNHYTPKEATEMASRAGVTKANMRLDKMFFSSFLAGCLLSFACAAVLVVNSSPWYQENAPGLIRMIGALIFPFGLVTIILTGADLCTGSFLFTTLATLHGRLSPLKMLIHWAVTFFGNLAGSLFIMALITGYGGTLSDPIFKEQTTSFAISKVVNPDWHQIFLRGIGANWLVCLACYLAFMAREYFSKVMAMWWPTFAFVTLAFDHVVANMFFVPAAIFAGAPEISVGYYIWKSLIPSLIGNIVGGGLFVGVMYWYMYLEGDSNPIAVDGAVFGEQKPLLGRNADISPADTNGRNSKEEV